MVTRSSTPPSPPPAAPAMPRGDGATLATDRPEDLSDQSLGDLLSRLSHDTSELISAQIELAREEAKEEVRKASRLGAIFGAAALLGFLALLLLTFAAAWGLTEIVPEGVAFLIVGAALAIVAAVAFTIARNELRETDFKPNETVETVKEDVQWARRQMS